MTDVNVYVSVYKRQQKGGTYYAKISINGRQSQASLGTKNKTIALKEAEALRVMLREKFANAEETVKSDGFTVARLRELHAAWGRVNTARETVKTRDWALARLERWMSTTGLVALGQMGKAQVEEWKAQLIEEGLSVVSVNSCLNSCRDVLNVALQLGWFDGTNHFRTAKRLRREKRLVRWLSREEIDKWLSTALDLHYTDVYLFSALAIHAGLRKREATYAKWGWVGWERKVLSVQAGPGFLPKSKEERVIPLRDELAAILAPYRRESGYIIKPDTAPTEAKYRHDVKNTFAKVAEAAEMPWVTPHILRHTFASQLAMHNVDIYKISRWLGHADVRTTQIYAHLKPADDDVNRF